MRRTKIQRELHQRLVEDSLVTGLAPRRIVRSMVATFQLTPRQARHDLHQVWERWREEDDQLRQGRWTDRDLALAADCRERQLQAAFEVKDLRRAAAVEKDRTKLLGLYAAERRRQPHFPEDERRQTVDELQAEIEEMYAAAPRNPDGSVVLTAYSTTPPPTGDAEYRRAIEQPRPKHHAERDGYFGNRSHAREK